MTVKEKISAAKTIKELEYLWERAHASGYAGPNDANPHGSMTYQAYLIRRAELLGEPVPVFPEPPGKDLPPIHGTWVPRTPR